MPACQNLADIDADIAVIGVPCATPSLHNKQYSLASLAGPAALRRASVLLSGYHDRHDWDLKPPVLAANRVVDIGDLPVNFFEAEANRTIIKDTVEAARLPSWPWAARTRSRYRCCRG